MSIRAWMGAMAVEKSPTLYIYKWQMGPEGQLATVMEGKTTKSR